MEIRKLSSVPIRPHGRMRVRVCIHPLPYSSAFGVVLNSGGDRRVDTSHLVIGYSEKHSRPSGGGVGAVGGSFRLSHLPRVTPRSLRRRCRQVRHGRERGMPVWARRPGKVEVEETQGFGRGTGKCS